jgi:hypothetical protein
MPQTCNKSCWFFDCTSISKLYTLDYYNPLMDHQNCDPPPKGLKSMCKLCWNILVLLLLLLSLFYWRLIGMYITFHQKSCLEEHSTKGLYKKAHGGKTSAHMISRQSPLARIFHHQSPSPSPKNKSVKHKLRKWKTPSSITWVLFLQLLVRI